MAHMVYGYTFSIMEPEHLFMNGCFNWMIPDRYLGHGCFHHASIKKWLFKVPGF